MPPVIHPIWLLLLICGVVLLVGCATLATRTPPAVPTPYPPVTLTGYVPVLSPTPLPTDWPYIPVTPSAPPPRGLPAATALPPLDIDAPVCHRQPTGRVLCLGRVRNPASVTMGAVRLRAAWLRPDGRQSEQHTIALEQQRIPPKGSAPYRILFKNLGDMGRGIVVGLAGARPQRTPAPQPTLEEDEVERLPDGRYRMTARIANPHTERLRAVRIIATLSDADGALVTYRAQMLAEPLAPGERRTIRLMLMPPSAVPDDLTAALHIESGTP